MEEKKTLGMKDNVFYGLSWLLMIFPTVDVVAAVLAIVALVKGEKDLEEKRTLVSIIICWAAKFVLAATGLVPAYVAVCAIIACIKAFKGGCFNVPGAYHLAKLFIK